MKIFFAVLFFISLTGGFVFAQNSFPELEIAKEIKLLKSIKSDVKAIMSEFDRDEEDEDDEESYHQEFRSDQAIVAVSYSTGDCEEYAGIQNRPEWNAPKMTATKIIITFRETTMLKDLGLNLSGFKKKLKDDADEDSNDYIYHDEKAGIIILTDEGEIEKIILHPPKKQSGRLCNNENNEEILSRKTSFVDSIIASDTYYILYNMPSNVTDLDLRTKDCKGEDCFGAKKEISVTTTAVDPENDVLTYQYVVTGGKIIGNGNRVIWDLTDVQPGSYTITAGSDDSCGICGKTQSREVLVNENSYELVPLETVKIKNLILDKTELIVGCPVGRLKRMLCPSGSCGVSVTSGAVASDNKNIIYKYETSAGKIVGNGGNVVWDLAGLPPGEYSITVAASSDGTVFGIPEKATIKIKENPSCSVSKK